MTLIIRPLQPMDADQAARLHIETWQDTYRGLMSDQKLDSLSFESFHKAWLERLSSPPQKKLVNFGAFLADGTLLGFGSAGEPRADWGYESELWAINIPKRFQKRGAGKALVRACVQHCLNFTAKNMYLYCMIGNDNAMQFYHYLGAVDTERVVDSEGCQERALVWDDLQALAHRLR